MGIFTCMADSLYSTPETNTTYISYTKKKIKQRKISCELVVKHNHC